MLQILKKMHKIYTFLRLYFSEQKFLTFFCQKFLPILDFAPEFKSFFENAGLSKFGREIEVVVADLGRKYEKALQRHIFFSKNFFNKEISVYPEKSAFWQKLAPKIMMF